MLESLFNKVAGLRAWKLYEKETELFSFEICEIFKNTFFYRATPMAASEILRQALWLVKYGTDYTDYYRSSNENK